jgi:hypothetical protein
MVDLVPNWYFMNLKTSKMVPLSIIMKKSWWIRKNKDGDDPKIAGDVPRIIAETITYRGDRYNYSVLSSLFMLLKRYT